MKYARHLVPFLMGVSLFTLPACDGIFEDIYNQPQESPYGFQELSTPEKPGTIYINASEYTRWIYINFHSNSIDSVTIVNGGEEYTGEWDMAVHRYDAKTNNGGVIETDYTDLNAFRNAGKMPKGEVVMDVETDSTIITDISHMMDNQIVYAKGKVNEKLSKWLNVDTSSMPPTYTMSNKVYVIALQDGTKAAVKLSNFMNDNYDKGFMTINYIYPVEF